jgi:pimeloyl-ACP methyl ester carboxylesterase
MDVLHSENSTTVRTSDVPAAVPEGANAVAAGAHPPEAEASWLTRDWRFGLVRAAMRAASAASTRLAAAWIDRLWFSATRSRPRPEAQAWLAACERVELRVHGQPVVAWARGCGPTALLVHGWSGHGGQLHAIGDALLRQGMRVVAFDAPAHGESGPSRRGGRRVSMVEFADALRVVAAHFGPVDALVAHSGGCTATALALREGWQGPERIAFVAPFALPSQAIAPFGRALGAADAAIERFRAGVERDFGRPWTDFDITGLPRLRALPPLLVVHDRGDREVPAHHGARTVAAWPSARLAWTTGLGHRRILRDAGVAATIATFLAEGRAHPRRGGGGTPPTSTPADARHELDRAFATAGWSPHSGGG